MRIAVAEIAQETDSFSSLRADLKDFESYGLYYGREIVERMPGVGPVGGFLEVAGEQKGPVHVLPIIRAWGSAGGTIHKETLEFLTARLVEGLKQSLPLDGVFLSLHGAAASENEDDVEGHLLQATRAVIGSGMPLVVALDHHANITQRMVDHASVLIGHETQPHDPPATGRKAARILFRMLRGEIHPTVAWRKIPMITPQDQFLTSEGPMKEWFDLARQMERRSGVLDVSPYPMQPWLDVAEGGWSVVVHTDNDPDLAQTLADEMADRAWSLRERFWESARVAPNEAVRRAVEAERGLVILSDTGDSVYGGAPGDSTCILLVLLDQRITCPAFVPMVDPEVLNVAISAGVGAQIAVDVGGKMDCVFSRPVRVAGKVAAISTGFKVDLHDRGICDLRRTALLQVGSIYIALLDHRSFAINHPVLYTHLGLDMADARMVVVKTASNFQFFSRWRNGLIRVDSPGTTQSDLTAFEWKRLPRPIYPLDSIADWRV
ncbi:MAG: M81 family metallopeptidase [Thermomicrobiales bacterium]